MTSETGASFAALQTQVKGLEGDYHDLKNTVLNLDRKIDHAFDALAAKLDAATRTPWPVIWAGMGVTITVIGLIGALAYAPINQGLIDVKQLAFKNNDKLTTLVEDLGHNYVGWREHERLIKESAELVKRVEYEQRLKSEDIQIIEVQKQIEEIKRAASSTWGLRDEMQRLQREIDRLSKREGAS